MNKNTLVFYHGNCRDGFTAAWAAWKKLGDSADYIPMVYSRFSPDKLPDTSGKDVYFLDFTPEDADLFRTVSNSHSTIIIDQDEKKKEYSEKGGLIISFREKVIDIMIRDHTQLVEFEGYEICAINAPRFFRSEIGDKLARTKPPFAIVWNYTPTDISVSLRSTEFDLIPIAAKFGGGGHKTAANFRLPLDAPLPWKKLK